MRKSSDAPQRLLVGPWLHDQIYTDLTEVGEIEVGENAVLGIEGLSALAIEWFDCRLRDRCSAEPPVRVYVLGENRWRDFDDWPPPKSRGLELFLSSSGKAARAPDDGRLDPTPPGRKSGPVDRFRFDPLHPVPTFGGANFHFFPEVNGPRDQREIEEREDVVVYTSDPIESDLLIAGPVRAILHVSTEGRDTDFTAKLVDVAPDGKAISVVDGILRLSYRDGNRERRLVQPGRVYEIEIDMGEIAMRIPAGHRLRLDVSSSNFPRFDRNPNNGEEPTLTTKLEPVLQTIHHSKRYPSRLALTVMKGDQP